jgi:beta-glucosidase
MSTVLLKNEGNLLPLKKNVRLALIGADATAGSYTAGQGSGGVQDSNVAVSPLAAMQALGVAVTYDSGATIEGAVRAASAADVAIVFGSAHSGEGHDRTDLLFSNRTGAALLERVIAAVANAQKKTVVVAAVPGQILTDWRDSVPAILTAFLPGEQYGNAIADILFGVVPPQAKLPLTFPNKDNEQGMTPAQWPGLPSTEFPGNFDAHYTEGLIVGYRWYDKHKVKPAFGFGHGLTYGNSTYSDLKVVKTGDGAWTVSFNIATTGGCDTPQLYLGYPDAATDPTVPTKVLRGFKKSCHAVSPREQIVFALGQRDVSEWDLAAKAWRVVQGRFAVYVGASSQDIRLTSSLTVS